MIKKSLFLVAIGLLAYFLEYCLGFTEEVTKSIGWLLLLPVAVLMALQFLFPQFSGRLKGANLQDIADKEAQASLDRVYLILSVLYGGTYLAILYQARSGKDCCKPLEILFSLSPTEMFWFGGPILGIWWCRQWITGRRETGA